MSGSCVSHCVSWVSCLCWFVCVCGFLHVYGQSDRDPAGTRVDRARGFREYGTELRILSVETFPDGRSLLRAVGTRRFRVLNE